MRMLTGSSENVALILYVYFFKLIVNKKLIFQLIFKRVFGFAYTVLSMITDSMFLYISCSRLL